MAWQRVAGSVVVALVASVAPLVSSTLTGPAAAQSAPPAEPPPNLLTARQSDFEVGSGGVGFSSRSEVVGVTGRGTYGGNSLRVTSVASPFGPGTISATVNGVGPDGGVPVEQGESYGASLWVMPTDVARPVSVAIAFFPDDGVSAPVVSYSTPVETEVGSYVVASVEAEAPVGDYHASVGISVDGTDPDESYQVDDASLWQGDLETADPQNLLDPAESTFERAPLGWAPMVGGSLDRVIGMGYNSPTAMRYTVGPVSEYSAPGVLSAAGTAGVPVDAEGVYRGSARVAVADQGEAGWAALLLAWFASDGTFMSVSGGEGLSMAATDGYQELSLETTPPEGAAFVATVIATGFEEGRQVVFDQMSLTESLGGDPVEKLAEPARTFETTSLGWSTQSATVRRSFGVSRTGSVALAVTAEAANAAIVTDFGTRGVPVEASMPFEFEISVATLTAAREVTPVILFTNENGDVVGVSNGAPVAETPWEWTTLSANGLAPAEAVYASVGVMFNGAEPGEVHYVDSARFSRLPLPECLDPEAGAGASPLMRSGESVADSGNSAPLGDPGALEAPVEPDQQDDPVEGLGDLGVEPGSEVPAEAGPVADPPATDLPVTIDDAPPAEPVESSAPAFAKTPKRKAAAPSALSRLFEGESPAGPATIAIGDESAGVDAVPDRTDAENPGFIVTGWSRQEGDDEGRFVAVRYPDSGALEPTDGWGTGDEAGVAAYSHGGHVLYQGLLAGSDVNSSPDGNGVRKVVTLLPFAAETGDVRLGLYAMNAADGQPVEDFAGDGFRVLPQLGSEDGAFPGDVEVLSTGTVLAGVSAYELDEDGHLGGMPIPQVRAFNEDGSTDAGFGDGGVTELSGLGGGFVTGVAEANGFIYVTVLTSPDGLPEPDAQGLFEPSSQHLRVVRLFRDGPDRGTVDADFAIAGRFGYDTPAGYTMLASDVAKFGTGVVIGITKTLETEDSNGLTTQAVLLALGASGSPTVTVGHGQYAPRLTPGVAELAAESDGSGYDVVAGARSVRVGRRGVPQRFSISEFWGSSSFAIGGYRRKKVSVDAGVSNGEDGRVMAFSRTDENGQVDPRLGTPQDPVPKTDDPVDLTTGNGSTVALDVAAPANASGMDYVRTFNSMDFGGNVFGPGWMASFQQYLVPNSDRTEVELRMPDGAHYSLTKDGSDWVAPPALGATLTETTGDGWNLTFPTGEVWVFDPDGQLTQIDQADDTTITLTNVGDDTVIAHSSGYQLTVSYEEGHVVSVTSNDGRGAVYAYTEGVLHTAATAEGETTYETDTIGRVTAQTDPDGVKAFEQVYDADGRVVMQHLHGREPVFICYYPDDNRSVVSAGPSGGEVSYTWDNNGNLTSMTDPHGKAASYTYDEAGDLTGFESRGGTTLVQTFDDDGHLLTSDDGSGNLKTLTWDSQGRLGTSTDATTGTTTYSYDGDQRQPSAVTDEAEHTTTYDVVDGLVRSTTDPDGVTTTYTYDDDTRELTAVTDGEGNTTSYGHTVDTETGWVTSTVTTTAGTTTTVTDAAGRTRTVTDQLGNVTTSAYNDKGQLVSATNPAGGRVTYDYDSVGLLAREADEIGNSTAHLYDAWGNETLTVNPDGTQIRRTFDELSRLMTETDELGRVTRYGYDDDGNQTTVTDPAGAVTETRYDALGRVHETVDPTGRITTTDYDSLGRVHKVTAPGGGETTYTYDALGRQTSVTDARGGVTETTYTPGGRVDVVTNPDGTTTDTDYDDAGEPIIVTGPLGETTTAVSWDGGHQVETTTAPGDLTTVNIYDEAGRLNQTIDPSGLVTEQWPDSLGRVGTKQTGTAGAIHYGYDAAGRMVAVTDGNGNETHFTYDWRGNKTSMTDALGNVTRWAYDTLGTQKSKTDPLGRTTTWTWDPTRRTQTVHHPSGRETNSTFDAAGRLAETTASLDTWTYTYNSAGRLDTIEGPEGDTTYTYDPGGAITSVTDPSGSIEATYDQAGRRTSRTVGDATIEWGYDETTGQMITATAAVGEHAAVSLSWGYDASGALNLEQFPGGQRTWTHSDGQLTGYTETIDGENAETTVSWDGAGKPSAISVDGTSTNLSFDAAGQLTQITGSSFTRSLSYSELGQREFDSVTGAYAYDAAGQLTARTRPDESTLTYNYDPDGRRLSSLDSAGPPTAFDYDANGHLIGKVHGADTLQMAYDNTGLLKSALATSSGGHSSQVTYTWDQTDSSFGLVALGVAGEERLAVPGPGHLTGLLTPAGSFEPLPRDVLQDAPADDSLEPFGTVHNLDGDASLFRSEVSLSGLVYLRNRVLDPETSQFIQPDPLSGVASTPTIGNPYHYGDNDPVTNNDPLGLSPRDCVFQVGKCRYVVDDLVNPGWDASLNPGDKNPPFNLGRPDGCYRPGKNRNEAYAQSVAVGFDPRMTYAIVLTESNTCVQNPPECPSHGILPFNLGICPHNQITDYWGDSKGPYNMNRNHFNEVIAAHPELINSKFSNLSWSKTLAAQFAAIRLKDIQALVKSRSGSTDLHGAKVVLPNRARHSYHEEPDSAYYLMSSVIAAGWYSNGGNSEVLNFLEATIFAKTPEELYRHANPSLRNISGSSRCYYNQYSKNFMKASKEMVPGLVAYSC